MYTVRDRFSSSAQLAPIAVLRGFGCGIEGLPKRRALERSRIMSAADESWMNRELFCETIAELRAQGFKVTSWYSEMVTGYRMAAYFARDGKVMLVEEYERTVVYDGQDSITRTFDVAIYERGHRPSVEIVASNTTLAKSEQ